MMLSSGIARVKKLEAPDSPVALGVAGSASNDCSNVIQEVRQAMYIQRLRYGSSKACHFDAYRWTTKGGAPLLGRDDIGTIEIGKAADLAIFKLDKLRFLGAHHPLAALFLCGAHQAAALFGKWSVARARWRSRRSRPKKIMEHSLCAQLKNSLEAP